MVLGGPNEQGLKVNKVDDAEACFSAATGLYNFGGHWALHSGAKFNR